ncbi:MAG: hypothetical protein ACHQUB_00985 [Candidatus Saccharimonadia bacterium]
MQTVYSRSKAVIDPLASIDSEIVFNTRLYMKYFISSEVIRRKNIKHVLELSCGNGFGLAVLSSGVHKITGIEHNTSLLQVAHDRKLHNAKLIKLDLNKNDLAKYWKEKKFGRVGAVLKFNSRDLDSNAEAQLRHLRTMLPRNGIFITSFQNSKYTKSENGSGRKNISKELVSIKVLKNNFEQAGFKVVFYGQPLLTLLETRLKFAIPILENIVFAQDSSFSKWARFIGFKSRFFSNFSKDVLVIAEKI